jgi:hypothetical protein
MKKIITLFIFISSIGTVSAQFFQGFGLWGGLSYYRQKWWLDYADGTEQKIKQKSILRFNAGLFAEFVKHKNFHWRTEFEYNQKGSKEKTSDDTYKNKLDYISWNNYLKIYEEEFEGTPYLLIGPRVEYLFKQNTQSPLLLDHFKTIHFSWSVGLGWEFTTFGRIKPLLELHYNADIDKAYKNSDYGVTSLVNRPWELRIGIRIGSKKVGCPAVYR